MNTRASQDANLNALINAGIREGGGVQFDIVPTQNSANGITSGGMYSTLKDSNIGFVDDVPTAGSNNLVKSGGVFNRVFDADGGVFIGSFTNTGSYNLTYLINNVPDNVPLYINVSTDNQVLSSLPIYFFDSSDQQLDQSTIILNQDNLLRVPSGTSKIQLYKRNNSGDTNGNYNVILRTLKNIELAVGYKNTRKLFISDTKNTDVPVSLIDYYATGNVDTAKEYYLTTCGIRNNNKAQTVIQIYDNNNVLEGNTVFDGSDNGIHSVLCAGFCFVIDASLLENSGGTYLGYKLHLNKYAGMTFDHQPVYGSGLPVKSDGIYRQIRSCKVGMFLPDSDFSNIPTGLLTIDYGNADSDLPEDIYLVTFGYRRNEKNHSLIICQDGGGNRLGEVVFDATDGSIKSVEYRGILFFIDCSKLPVNTENVYLGYNIHLNRDFYEPNPDKYRNAFTFEEGTKIVSFGDSITMGNGTQDGKDYPTVMGRYLKSKVYNLGLGGTTLCDLSSASFCDVVDAIIDNDWTDIDAWIAAAVEEYPWMSYLTTRYAEFKQIDFSTVDMVTIAYGTNDWGNGYTIDNDNNPLDKNTILGGLRYGVSRLLENYPRLHVYVFTPAYRWFEKDSGGNITLDSDTKKINNTLLSEVGDAIYEACQKLSIPCKNMYYCSNVNKYTADYYLADKTHRNEAGAKLLASQYAKFIDSE